jgi:hypothetical protein
MVPSKDKPKEWSGLSVSILEIRKTLLQSKGTIVNHCIKKMGYGCPLTEFNKMKAKQEVSSCKISGYRHVF